MSTKWRKQTWVIEPIFDDHAVSAGATRYLVWDVWYDNYRGDQEAEVVAKFASLADAKAWLSTAPVQVVSGDSIYQPRLEEESKS